MTYKIIIFTRDDISLDPSVLVDGNDKRKQLLKRFDYTTKVLIKKIEGEDISLKEIDSFYTSAKTGLNENDIIVFIDDRSISSIETTEIATILTYIQDVVFLDNTDVFYFANSMDNCQTKTSYTEPSSDTIKQLNFYKTRSPNGFFAIGATKSKWNDILDILDSRYEVKMSSRMSGAINDGDLIAGTSYPRIFTPDINRISDGIDIIHTYPCRIEIQYGKPIPDKDEMAFYWFVVGVVIVLLICWLLSKVLYEY